MLLWELQGILGTATDYYVHFVAVPKKEESLARCFSDTHVRYTRMINFRERWHGHLWQGRFSSSPLDERYLLAAVRYVERNPVRAKIVRLPWRYEYSSAGYNAGEKSSDPLVKGDTLLHGLVADWKAFLEMPDDEEDMHKIRKEESGGRPIGSNDFVLKIEKKLKRVLQRGVPGRPKVGTGK